MNWSKWVRSSHRWLSIAFTLTVVAIFAAQGAGSIPPQWVYFLPLFPLFFMTLTGLYMFFLPHFSNRRDNQRNDSNDR